MANAKSTTAAAKASAAKPAAPAAPSPTAAELNAISEALRAAHLDAAEKLKTHYASMPQAALLADVGNALLKPEIQALAMTFRTLVDAVEHPLVKANLGSLCDLIHFTPILIAQHAQQAQQAKAPAPQT